VAIAFLVKFFAIVNTNFDLFGDEAQYWIWSQNLNFGYYSKPPLLAWVIGSFTFLFGDSFEMLKIIPISTYVLSSYVIYLISLELYNNKKLAILSGGTFYLLPAVSVSSFLISTDVILILFWSLSLLFLIKIRKNPKIINFFLLGIFLGLSFLAKYAAIYFLISMVVLLFLDETIKKIIFKKFFHFALFLGTAIIVLSPNIIWNIKNNWVTLSHTSDNASLDKLNFNLLQGGEFILSQGIMVGPLLFIFFLITINKIKYNFETKFLLSFSLPILLIVFGESVLVRANANWAAVALVSLSIFFTNHIYNLSKKILLANNLFNFCVCVVLFFFISNNSSLKIFDRINGISAFATTLLENHMDGVDYLVVEDRLLFSNLKYILNKSQIKIYTSHEPGKKITSSFHLSDPLPHTFGKNFIFLGNLSEINYLIKKKQVKKIEQIKVIFKKEEIEVYEVNF
jgi:4-amino-4-deoxy-L-arabinose transferase-like glycosyltransferase